MKTTKEGIKAMINAMREMELSEEERAVMNCLLPTFGAHTNGKRRKITQSQIAQNARWMGSHPHENYSSETTLRKIRQVIRDLRMKRGAPILSDTNGYWIPEDKSEIDGYIEQLELIAKAQTKAWFETYEAMKRIFDIHSEYFEGKNRLW